jgi:hypothetical protein
MTVEEVKEKYILKPTELMYELGEVAKEFKENYEYWYHDPKPDDPIMQAHFGYFTSSPSYLPYKFYVDTAKGKERPNADIERLRSKIDKAIINVCDKDDQFFKDFPVTLMCHCKSLHDTYIVGDVRKAIKDSCYNLESKYEYCEKIVYTDGDIIHENDCSVIKNYDRWDCKYFHIENYHCLMYISKYYDKNCELIDHNASLVVY